MWGAHIGLGFATVIQHGGFLVLVLLGLVAGPFESAMLFAAYWLGRTLPIWFAGLFASRNGNAPELIQDLLSDSDLYRRAAGAGLLCVGAFALLQVSQSIPSVQ
jgi:cytochrome c biogenesis protein CcdA